MTHRTTVREYDEYHSHEKPPAVHRYGGHGDASEPP